MAEPLGKYFKRAREEKGWTLEQAAAKIRILPQYLQAVEEDNYERLPEEVFAKGFVRSYARLLGLGEADVLQKFQETGGQFYAKRAEREQLRVQQREEERRKKTNQFIVAGAIGVALVVLFLATGRDRDSSRGVPETSRPVPIPSIPREPPPGPSVNPPAKMESTAPAGSEPAAPRDSPRSDPPARESTPAISRDPVPVTPKEPPKAAPSHASGESERTTGREAPTDGALAENKKLVLVVEATERSWILVRADHNPAQDVLLYPGEHVRWSAADKLTLTLGNAGGVRILINGKAQGPYGTSGEVVKDLVFTRDDG